MRMDGPGAETLPRSVLHKEPTPGAAWARIHPGSIDLIKDHVMGLLSLCAPHSPTFPLQPDPQGPAR